MAFDNAALQFRHPASQMEASPRPAVIVKDLEVTFEQERRSIQAVRGLSLDIRQGEILGLVGESGSGKSVLGQTMLGLLTNSGSATVTGQVLVNDVDIMGASPRARRRLLATQLGAVFQDPMTSLNPSMTIGKQLREVCGSNEEAIAALEAVGLPDAARRLGAYPHQLSGGQRQRVMIAMAVVRKPALIVADEPTTALDVTVQAQILDLFAELRDTSNCSIMLITHDLAVAAKIADRIAVMYAGKVVEIGAAAQVLDDPRHPYTQGLLGSRFSLYGVGKPRGPLPISSQQRSQSVGCAFADRCDYATDTCVQVPALQEAAPSTDLVAAHTAPAGEAHRVACWHELEARAGTDEAEWVTPADIPVRVATADAPTLVSTHKLSRAYRARHGLRNHSTTVLDQVDFEVHAGESVAVVGESGSGKSTLLRLIADLDKPDHGTISRAFNLSTQMVFQDAASSLTPWMTMQELLNERLDRAKYASSSDRRARVGDLLRLVGLPASTAKARPSELSGGQNQRVALARCLASEPQLLLADEPTSSLDVSLAAATLDLLMRLRDDLDFALVFVTHDLAIARRVSERTAVMYQGRIVEQGDTNEVLTHPRNDYTKRLLDSILSVENPDLGAESDAEGRS